MHVIVVDDERIALELLVSAILQYDSDTDIHMFRSPQKALEYAQGAPCDVAFLDVQMFGMSGVELAAKLKEIHPNINVVFTTGYSEYMGDAFNLHASGYLLKPITPEKVRKEMENLRNPLDREEEKRVWIRCFGNFEIFIDKKIVNFKYSKAKELLAYLVDRRGSACTNGEIMAALWETQNHSSYLRNVRKDLVDTLKSHGCENLVISERSRMSVDPKEFGCDFYNWMDNPDTESYFGQYMSQYSWAEETNAYISNQVQSMM